MDDPVLESADAVFVATGSKPVMPAIPGIEKAIDVEQIHKNGMPEGKNVVICGGGLSACDTAIEYAAKGDRKFTIVEMLPQLASDVMVVNKISIDRLLNEYGVEQLVNTKVVASPTPASRSRAPRARRSCPPTWSSAPSAGRAAWTADVIQNKYPMKTTIIRRLHEARQGRQRHPRGLLRGNGPQVRNSFPKKHTPACTPRGGIL